MSNCKKWIYTLNNYTTEDINQLQAFTTHGHRCCKEIGGEGTPHLQGAILFTRKYRITALKKLNPRIHWEASKTNDPENYCTKGEIIIDIPFKGQGTRTDLKVAASYIKEGRMSDLKEEMPEAYIRYHSGLEKLAQHYQKPRDFKPYVEWIYGPTGVGKTRTVVSKEKSLWISGKNLRWWQGYENQETTLFDDFRRDFCTYHELLRILDRYPYTVEVKGGSRQLNSKRMYITSCHHPADVYDTREDIQQLLRRIDKITYIGTSPDYLTKEERGAKRSTDSDSEVERKRIKII